jgi:hypothetical protein
MSYRNGLYLIIYHFWLFPTKNIPFHVIRRKYEVHTLHSTFSLHVTYIHIYLVHTTQNLLNQLFEKEKKIIYFLLGVDYAIFPSLSRSIHLPFSGTDGVPVNNEENLDGSVSLNVFHSLPSSSSLSSYLDKES